MTVSLKSNIPSLIKDTDEDLGKVVRRLALELEGDIKQSMSGPKSGKIYKRRQGNRVVTHQASAAGESPAIDSSAYLNSIQAIPTGPLSAEVGTNIVYGPRLELGDGDFAKRPHFTPAAHKMESEMPKEVAGSIKITIEKNAVK